MLAQLIPVGGGKAITLTKDVTLVGRKSRLCDLIVDRGSVSKLHCLIVKTDGLLYIRDLGSTNGTKVNGQRVTRGALLPGDELAFAGAKFRVHLGPSPDDAPPPLAAEEREEPTERLPRSAVLPASAREPRAEIPSESDVRLLSDDHSGA